CAVSCARCWALLCNEGVEPSALPTARPGVAVSPATGTRSPVTPQDASIPFQFDAPPRLLDGRVQLTNLLCQIIRLSLERWHIDRRDPADFLHPVAFDRLDARVDHTLKDAVAENEAIALRQCLGQ